MIQELMLVHAEPVRCRFLVTLVHDGDTLRGVADLGFGISMSIKVRLARINAPELPTPEGIASTEWLKDAVLHVGAASFHLVVYGQEKWGRWLSELIAPGEVNVNDMMVREGMAKHV